MRSGLLIRLLGKIELFPYMLRLRGYERISIEVAVLEEVDHAVWPKISGRRGRPPPTIRRVAKLGTPTFHMV